MNRIVRSNLFGAQSRRLFSNIVTRAETSTEKSSLSVPSNYDPPQPIKPVVEQVKKPTKLHTQVHLMRTRAVWFCVGGFTFGLFGYWRLGEEIHQANTDLKSRLAGAHSDVQTLQSHIKEVELRLSKLEHHTTLTTQSQNV